jgi:hypothetical protein
MTLPADPAKRGYSIRAPRTDEIDSLAALEARSAKLFGNHGYPAIADAPARSPAELAAFFADNAVWIAAFGKIPIGFAMAGVVGTAFYLKELRSIRITGSAGSAQRYSKIISTMRGGWVLASPRCRLFGRSRSTRRSMQDTASPSSRSTRRRTN